MHMSPEQMAGAYANFANVSHSDYEFTITFARLDHEVEDEEIPGVVVSRINLSPRFMRELIDALEDNYSKWRPARGSRTSPSTAGRRRARTTTSLNRLRVCRQVRLISGSVLRAP